MILMLKKLNLKSIVDLNWFSYQYSQPDSQNRWAQPVHPVTLRR